MAGSSSRLKVKELAFDPRVQRPLDPNWVAKIVADFDPTGLGVIEVSLRDDGIYYVIDGQHRVEALRRLEMDDFEIEALVHKGLTLSDEAAMFRRLNNFRQVHPLDRFRVRVVEGDKVAVTLNNMLQQRGWRVAAGSRTGVFGAVTTLENLYKGPKGAEENLLLCDTVMRIITTAWEFDPAGARAEIVGGLGAVLKRYGDQVNQQKLVTQLQKASGGPRGLVAKAKQLRDMRGGRVGDAVAEILVTMLNTGAKTRKLAPWVA